MTDSFDLKLRHRLEELANAVPVDPPQQASGTALKIVRAEPATHGLIPVGLTPLLGVLLVGILVAGLARIGPFGPSAPGGSNVAAAVTATAGSLTAVAPSQPPTPGNNNGKVSTDPSGDFGFSLSSDKSTYHPDEPISISGALVYRGPKASIAICYQDAVMGFGIREKVYGGIELSPHWLAYLVPQTRLTLDRDVPFSVPFRKSAGWSQDDPAAESFHAFALDPILRLPSGTWHVYAEPHFGVCDGSYPNLPFDLGDAELTVVVQ